MLNFESIGIPIATIKSVDIKKKQPTVYLASPEESSEIRHGMDIYTLPSDKHFECAINTDTERQIVYVSGSSGSGKSYWCRQYIQAYQKAYPKREIYVFSAIAEDPSIDKIKNLHRIKLTDSFIEDDLSAEDFEKSLTLFDDCDTITNSKLRKAVMKLQDDILQTGRHFEVSAVITSHLSCNGKETRLILAEAHIITFFPSQMSVRGLKYLLESYIGLSKDQIHMVKNLPGRAVSYIRGCPRVLVSDKQVMTISNK